MGRRTTCRFPDFEDLQEIVVDTAERLQHLINKGPETAVRRDRAKIRSVKHREMARNGDYNVVNNGEIVVKSYD